jgi:hypothetical protein
VGQRARHQFQFGHRVLDTLPPQRRIFLDAAGNHRFQRG